MKALLSLAWGTYLTGWLPALSAICGFCQRIMEVWNPQEASSTLQEQIENLKAPTCCSLGVTCNELLPVATPPQP